MAADQSKINDVGNSGAMDPPKIWLGKILNTNGSILSTEYNRQFNSADSHLIVVFFGDFDWNFIKLGLPTPPDPQIN